MNINFIEGGVCAPKGFKAAGVNCGIRKGKMKKDLTLIVSDVECSAAGVFTKNKVKGAPIKVSQDNLVDGKAKAIICNSGNANTCAANGIEIAEGTCQLVAEALKIKSSEVLIASTGVIGEPMEMGPFKKGVPKVVKQLSDQGSDAAAQGILTTDTVKKENAVSFIIDNKECHIGGIAKGSGMINPNMATMLSFITSDVAISPEMLQKALSGDILDSFNQISIDGDTSTNDTVFILANGLSGNKLINSEGEDYDTFCKALNQVSVALSRGVAKDGEGATKLVECVVSHAPTKETARLISKSVINSSLLKCAVFGEDANWGRVLCAIGYTEADFEADNIDVTISSAKGNVDVCKKSAYSEYSEEEAKEILMEDEVKILINMNQGKEQACAWGCDLTYDYVKINGDYRS